MVNFFDSINRLRPSKTRDYRLFLLSEQSDVCGLCCDIIQAKPVLDHCHRSGRIRSVLHDHCNRVLGKVENAITRHKIPMSHVEVFAHGVFKYLTKDYSHMPYHPSYRTDEEKKVRRNKKAKERRQKKKNGLSEL